MSYTPRYYQSESCQAAWQSLKNNAGNPVIVLPTGAGKSVVIAEICRAAVQDYQGRVIVLAHRAELLKQNAEKIQALLPFGITCGIFSAGLRRFAMDDHIICGGIQSVYKRAADFGRRHLVLIDEVHLTPEDGEGMYRRFIEEMTIYNPRLKIIGLTATPYRMATGSICGPDKLFTHICYSAKIPRLIADGFLCPVVTSPTKELFDTSNLHVRKGEFVAREVEELFDNNDKTIQACREIVDKCRGRNSVLIFSCGIQHAEHIADSLAKITGEQVGCVTGETPQLIRESTLRAFREQRLHWLVNVDVLTTGFDAPCIDAIAVLRATHSPGLFAQICGRGFRTHESKQDCLIMDYGSNIKRHGPIDSDSYGMKPKAAKIEASYGDAEPGQKKCPACGVNVPNSTRVCPGDEEMGHECGWLFANIDTFADSTSQLLAKPEKWIVTGCHMNRHRKKKSSGDAPDTLRVTYTVEPVENSELNKEVYTCKSCGATMTDDVKTIMPEGYIHYARLDCYDCGTFIQWLPKPKQYGNLAEKEISEWLCFEHPDGWAKVKANEWLIKRTIADPNPELAPIEQVIDLFERGAIANTLMITTMKDGHFYKIINCQIDEIPQHWNEPRQLVQAGEDEWGQPIYEEVNQDEELPF